jgi:Flp pilus assembly pilin Flp
MVEYALILSLVTVAAAPAFVTVGKRVRASFTETIEAFSP